MPIKYYTHTAAYPHGAARYVTLDVFHDWERSPRVDGKLILRSNPWSLSVVSAKCTNAWNPDSPAPIVYPHFVATTNEGSIVRARARAQSDLRGVLARKVKDKNAGALGVSIASSAQSIAMLRSSSASLIGIFEAAERFYRTTRGKKRLKRFRRLVNRGAQPTAGMVLAGFFGWAPLLEDFSSAMKTLANPWPPSWVSARKPFEVAKTTSVTQDEYYRRESTWSATGHSTYSCRVEVSNPNLWVANKLGLVNPFSVIWDLVPWSFLVNMVSNMGQVMGSLTDFAGLALTDTSLTDRLLLSETTSVIYQDPRPGALSTGSGTQDTKIHGRVIGVAPPGVTPYFRFPEWNVGLAAITGSLLIQQSGRLQKVLKF